MKSDLIVSDRIGITFINAARSLPLPQQRLTVQLLQKATHQASYAKLTFDWLCKMVQSQVAELI